jgi:hypothetical protein
LAVRDYQRPTIESDYGDATYVEVFAAQLEVRADVGGVQAVDGELAHLRWCAAAIAQRQQAQAELEKSIKMKEENKKNVLLLIERCRTLRPPPSG